ncbi:541_t:CDS:2, partial [Dentiscutata heterogama]
NNEVPNWMTPKLKKCSPMSNEKSIEIDNFNYTSKPNTQNIKALERTTPVMKKPQKDPNDEALELGSGKKENKQNTNTPGWTDDFKGEEAPYRCEMDNLNNENHEKK